MNKYYYLIFQTLKKCPKQAIRSDIEPFLVASYTNPKKKRKENLLFYIFTKKVYEFL